MTGPATYSPEPPLRYVQPRRCPTCDGTRVFGETGWRCCTECGWDELPRSALRSPTP